jgi:L(+)-tartrate dehydratase beta subunit
MSVIRLDTLQMNEVRLQCPVEAEDLRKLKLGDLVYLDGVIFTGREGLYHRLLEEGMDLPVPWGDTSNVNFHCSPAASPEPDGSYRVQAVTGTASFRFGKWMKAFFDKSHCKLIIGKGGMTSNDYKRLFVPEQAIYLTTVGYGLGAMYGRGVTGVKAVHWLKELGIAQAMWVLEVSGLGPFIVESDTEGNSLFELCNEKINEKLAQAYQGLPQPALRRYGEETDRGREIV